MSEQTQVQPPIEPHQAAIEKMLADATAAGNDFDRLTFLSRCNSALSRECEETAERLLKVHRGRLSSVGWNVDFEYDDEGGTFPSVSGITLHLEDGREILLGDTNYAFNDDGVIDDFIILGYTEAKELEQALEQEGVDPDEAFVSMIAEMAGIHEERINDYLGVLADYINENPREESLMLDLTAPLKAPAHA